MPSSTSSILTTSSPLPMDGSEPHLGAIHSLARVRWLCALGAKVSKRAYAPATPERFDSRSSPLQIPLSMTSIRFYDEYRDKYRPSQMDLEMEHRSVQPDQPMGGDDQSSNDRMDISTLSEKSTEPRPEACRSVFATRTQLVNQNKYQKRVGAKKAKKLELDNNSAFTLSPADATTYRALAARCNYLSQGRPDISFSSKELCREFSIPNLASFKKLIRLVRYLSRLPRLVYRFPFQDEPKSLDVYVDTDFAGCASTRRSTSGGCAMIGGCTVKHWSKTQSTISLSSGEAELHGITMGCTQGLGL